MTSQITEPNITSAIKRCLDHIDSNFGSLFSNGPSYLSDLIGKLLIDIYYRPDQFDFDLLERAIEISSSKPQLTGIINGSLGVALIIELLVEREMLSKDESLRFDEVFMQLMYKDLGNDFKEKNYDLLDGYLTKGIYFLQIEDRAGLELIIKELAESREEIEGFNVWVDYLNLKFYPDSLCVNFGLSHGLCSIISFLIECYKKDILAVTCYELISEAIAFMLHFAKSDGDTIFPSKLNIKTSNVSFNERLAWCYGDLSTSLIMLKAGYLLNNEVWQKKGMDILEIASKKDFTTAKIYRSRNAIDNGFCHGVAGVMHLYNRILMLTKTDIAADQLQYWKNLLIDDFDSFDFRFPEDTTKDTWGINNSVLVGAASVCLPLISLTHPNLQWDKMFLTNLS